MDGPIGSIVTSRAPDGADDKDVYDSAMQCNAYISEGLKVVEKSSVQCSLRQFCWMQLSLKQCSSV